LGEGQIDQDEVWALPVCQLQALFPILGLDDGEATVGQIEREDLHMQRVVLGDQDFATASRFVHGPSPRISVRLCSGYPALKGRATSSGRALCVVTTKAGNRP